MKLMHRIYDLWDLTLGKVLRNALVGLIIFYRKTISPLYGNVCRYYPSCSTYGLEAVRVHGAGKGSLLTAWRILRCNPWTQGGIDHVPARGAWPNDDCHNVRIDQLVENSTKLDRTVVSG